MIRTRITIKCLGILIGFNGDACESVTAWCCSQKRLTGVVSQNVCKAIRGLASSGVSWSPVGEFYMNEEHNAQNVVVG